MKSLTAAFAESMTVDLVLCFGVVLLKKLFIEFGCDELNVFKDESNDDDESLRFIFE